MAPQYVLNFPEHCWFQILHSLGPLNSHTHMSDDLFSFVFGKRISVSTRNSQVTHNSSAFALVHTHHKCMCIAHLHILKRQPFQLKMKKDLFAVKGSYHPSPFPPSLSVLSSNQAEVIQTMCFCFLKYLTIHILTKDVGKLTWWFSGFSTARWPNWHYRMLKYFEIFFDVNFSFFLLFCEFISPVYHFQYNIFGIPISGPLWIYPGCFLFSVLFLKKLQFSGL